MPGSKSSLLSAALGAFLLAACGDSAEPAYLPVPDGGLALIAKSRSTNTRAVTVVIYPDGSAVRSIAEDGGYWVDNPNGPRADLDGGIFTLLPMTFPPHSPEIETFLSDLARVDDVADIPGGNCAKSISFGTTTVLSANHHTSPDIECVHSASDEEQALVNDCLSLTNASP